MFCYQCEETINAACTKGGACGKTPDVSDLQDLLIHTLGEIAREDTDEGAMAFIAERLFSTITNANFDKDYFISSIGEAFDLRDRLRAKKGKAAGWRSERAEELVSKGRLVGIGSLGAGDIQSLKSLILYGAKGIAAYRHHAWVLGKRDTAVDAFLRDCLARLPDEITKEELLDMVDRCGAMGVLVMALLDSANSGAFGVKAPVSVDLSAGERPGILVSGHDLRDIHDLLSQSEGEGIDIYTHGEMLISHAYPELAKHEHLRGNYGGSWYLQGEEFESFNGPILLTSNCIIPPKKSYAGRLYTTGACGWNGVRHIEEKGGKKDFSLLIAQAKGCPPPIQGEDGAVMTGFGHEYLRSNADTILSLVQEGRITKFIVMAGCDGRDKDRSYYTEFAKMLPKTAVILTAGCAKFRYNKLGLGDIRGIPRVIDAGQCNDSYSLVTIAMELAEMLGVGINDLPIAYNIAWYEQKAVLVLLSLLHLGVTDITLGPRLPAFVSPGIHQVLASRYGLRKNGEIREDLRLMA